MPSIKECIVSRHTGGVILELDVKQLEIVAAAHLSQDKVMLVDIVGGLDLHCMALANWKGLDYSSVVKDYRDGDTHIAASRRMAKVISFQLLYGATVNGIMRTFKLPKKEAQAFVDGYYGRYLGLKAWQEYNINKVGALGILTGTTGDGEPTYTSKLKSATGRVFTFSATDEGRYKKALFSPTKIKNYPVQGFATGDLFQLLLGKMYRRIRREWPNGEVLMVNTVHDSIIFDIKDRTSIMHIGSILREEAEKTGEYLLESLGVDLSPLKIEVDIEYGPDWAHLHESI